MSTRTVTTQAELDAALAEFVDQIIIDSPAAVWLTAANPRASKIETLGWSCVEVDNAPYVVAWGQSQVVAKGESYVQSWTLAYVEARGSSHVEARESSRVNARELSSVEAWDKANVEASAGVVVRRQSAHATIIGGVVINMTDPMVWCEREGVRTSDGKALVYKAVSSELVAGQDHNPTTYTIGATVETPDWKPNQECGHGLHFGASPRHAVSYYQGDEDRSECRFLACEIDIATAIPLNDKIKAPSCLVLHEVDIDGNEVSA